MYRNDHPTAGPNGEFLSEVAPGQPATKWPADHMTETQEEICNAIEGLGIPLQKNVRTQLRDAILSAVGPAPNAGVKNALINAAFEVAQFGTSGSIAGFAQSQATGIDRWRINPGGAGGNVQYSSTSFAGAAGEPPGNPHRFLRQQILGTQPGSSPRLVQRIEKVLTLANSPVVVSFYARCASGTLNVTPQLIQFFGSGGGASANVLTAAGSVTVTTAWGFYTVALTLPSIVGKTLAGGDDYLQFQVLTPSGSTYTLDLWGVQLERGASATSFDRRGFSDELLRCMRYRETSLPYGQAAPAIGGGGLEDPKTAALKGYQPTPMTGSPPLETWEIWSIARHFRVLKRAPTGGAGSYITWHNTLSLPTANSVVVNGVVRSGVLPHMSSVAHTGSALLPSGSNPGAGPSVCEAHWVWEDPVI